MTFALTTGPSVSIGVAAIPIPGTPTAAPDATGMPMCPTIIISGSPVTNLMVKRMSIFGTPTQDLVPSSCVFYKGAPAVTMISPIMQDGAVSMHPAPDQVKVMILR